MQACNLARILRLTVVVLSASVLLPDCNAASETQESVDSVSDMHHGSETDPEFVRYYNVTIIHRERLIVFVALALFIIVAAVIAIRSARNRGRTMSSTDDHSIAQQSDFVEDGAERLAAAIRSDVLPGIQADVTAEYSDRLAAAGFLRRMWLRRRMKVEVERRVEEEIETHMPSDETLY